MTVRALCRMDYLKLVEILEASLRKLGYSYLKNQGMNFTEYDVQSPCQLMATVENLTRLRPSFLIRSPIVVESAIELRRIIGAKGSAADQSACASALAQEIRSALPKQPWKGTGVYRSRAERTSWERLGEL